ncbi:MAG: hypothetical protein Q8K15_04245, partial [Candidatus Omnitrophota bacterium]|nr:hypothetical protein [Candidatus Omnitrophota bacterium]
MEVEIPESSRLNFDKLTPEELEERLSGLYSKAEDIQPIKTNLQEGVFKHSPFTTKLYLELPAPSLNDSVSDL